MSELERDNCYGKEELSGRKEARSVGARHGWDGGVGRMRYYSWRPRQAVLRRGDQSKILKE